MPPALSFLIRPIAAGDPGASRRVPWLLLALLHLAALAVLIWSEADLVSAAAFVLAWGLLNFLWLAILRRPMAAAALSLAMIAVIVLLSRFKHDVLLMTINFLDIMIIDADTFAFLLTVFPDLGWTIVGVAALVVPAIALLWWFDPLRVRLRAALIGRCGVPCGSCARFRSRCRTTSTTSSPTSTTSRNSRAPASPASSISTPAAISNPTPR